MPLEDEEDEAVGGGFFTQNFESIGQFSLDMDASQLLGEVEPFIDTKGLTSNHILTIPGEEGEVFLQRAQEQFEEGEKLKFVDVEKARNCYVLASSCFRRAAEGINDNTVKQSMLFLSNNADIMAMMIEKYAAKSMTSNGLDPSTSSPTSRGGPSSPQGTLTDASKKPVTERNPGMSDSAAHLENVLNAPHHYDRVYSVLPMSSSRSFFGDFSPSAPSGENSRIALSQSRLGASGISRVPSADMSLSSSLSSSQNSTSTQLFLRDLRVLERRLGSIGLMPLAEPAAAASLLEKESISSKTALTSSTARLNNLPSRLDESFIVLPTDNQRSGNGTNIASIVNGDNIPQLNPYGGDKKQHSNIESSNENSSNTSVADSTPSSENSYWGAGMGLLKMASNMTGISSSKNYTEHENLKSKSGVLSTAPYGGAAAQHHTNTNSNNIMRSAQQTSSDTSTGSYKSSRSPEDNSAVHWNDASTLNAVMSNSAMRDGDVPTSSVRENRGRRRVDSWENVSPSGEPEVVNQNNNLREDISSNGDHNNAAGVLRLLKTIERLSEENVKLEEKVENLKSAQLKNSMLTAQIDKFKVEYKLKIDQMKNEIMKLSVVNSSDNKSEDKTIFSEGNVSLSADVKDKKLHELDKTVNALLRKMTQMKADSDYKDKVIKLYEEKRARREKEKRSKREKEKVEVESADINGRSSNKLSGGTRDNEIGYTHVSSAGENLRHHKPPVKTSTSENVQSSLSTRRGIASKMIDTSSSSAISAKGIPSENMGSSQLGKSNGSQSRSRISLTSASPSTATSTLRTSLKREISAGSYSPPKPNSSLRKGHQPQRK